MTQGQRSQRNNKDVDKYFQLWTKYLKAGPNTDIKAEIEIWLKTQNFFDEND